MDDSSRLDPDEYVELLTKLIGESEFVQNAPELGKIPNEDRVSDHVLERLAPYTKENGGPLEVERITYVEGRGNVMITYKAEGASDKTCSFVGSHMDVVPANPESWDWDPFHLTRDGDKLYGRGTTDCLGHVALLTELFVTIAQQKPKLSRTIVAIFITNEEGGGPGVGVDALVEHGRMEHLKDGPLFWVDSADSQPCMGTAGALQWHLKTVGKLFHSGLPHKGINSIELAMEAVSEMQQRFYRDFGPHPDEAKYKFATPSTMKPTQIECAKGSLNQIPPNCTVSGDVRLSPFYEVKDCMAKIQSYVDDINSNIGRIPTRGPCSTFQLPDGDIREGKLEFEWAECQLEGVACNLDGLGHAALCKATEAVLGKCEPYSISGSLPLVKDLQRAGFDVQICGYGLLSTYHADNEYCLLSGMEKAYQILLRCINHTCAE